MGETLIKKNLILSLSYLYLILSYLILYSPNTNRSKPFVWVVSVDVPTELSWHTPFCFQLAMSLFSGTKAWNWNDLHSLCTLQ